MATRPLRFCPRVLLLLVGATALVGGVSLVAAGLDTPDRSLALAVPAASGAQAAALDHGTTPSFPGGCACGYVSSRADADSDADGAARTRQTAMDATDVTPALRRTREHVAGDGLGHAFVQSNDARNELMRTAMARWERAQQAHDDLHLVAVAVWRWAPLR